MGPGHQAERAVWAGLGQVCEEGDGHEDGKVMARSVVTAGCEPTIPLISLSQQP